MSEFDRLRAEMEKLRDEIRLKIHLGSMEAKDEWSTLEKRWDEFTENAQLQRSAEGVGSAVKDLGGELKQAYRRLHNALSD